ncbi:MAG: hypothetical protein ACREHD_29280 [Pirellulales bacterium]
MNYRVRWSAVAEDELTRIWLQASDRDEVTKAAQSIDKRLAGNAPNEGESRVRGRIIFASPLAARYRVYQNSNDVEVAHVWRYRAG